MPKDLSLLKRGERPSESDMLLPECDTRRKAGVRTGVRTGVFNSEPVCWPVLTTEPERASLPEVSDPSPSSEELVASWCSGDVVCCFSANREGGRTRRERRFILYPRGQLEKDKQEGSSLVATVNRQKKEHVNIQHLLEEHWMRPS